MPTLLEHAFLSDIPEGDNYYSQAFTTATTVVVLHNLNKMPSVTVVDSAGDVVEGSIRRDSLNQVTVTFTAAFSGIIYCN